MHSRRHSELRKQHGARLPTKHARRCVIPTPRLPGRALHSLMRCSVCACMWCEQKELEDQKPRKVKFLQRGGGKNAMTERLRVEKEKVRAVDCASSVSATT